MNYNREFLVPYLENICALELAKEKMQRQYRNSKRYIEEANSSKEYYPAEPEPNYGLTYGFILMGIACFLGTCFDFGDPLSNFIIKTLPFLAGPLLILSAVMLWREENKQYKIKMKSYRNELAKAEKHNDSVRRQKNSIQSHIQDRNFAKSEVSKINRVLDEGYSANIIPSHYRNMYVAVYLYDYFRTSQSTDLERALTLFVLEEIKSRLDTIIQQQSEMILNQQMMIAEQRKTREQQERYANQMIAKLDNIAASNEERNTYLDMIEANTRATAYFAAAEYLK